MLTKEKVSVVKQVSILEELYNQFGEEILNIRFDKQEGTQVLFYDRDINHVELIAIEHNAPLQISERPAFEDKHRFSVEVNGITFAQYRRVNYGIQC